MTKTMRYFSTSVIVLLLAATIAPLLSGQSKGDQEQLANKFKMTRSDLNEGEKLLAKKQYDPAEAVGAKIDPEFKSAVLKALGKE